MGGPPFFALVRRAEASKPLWNRHQERRLRGGAGRVRAFRERLTRRIFAMEMGRRWEVISVIISGGRVVRVGVVFSAILGIFFLFGFVRDVVAVLRDWEDREQKRGKGRREPTLLLYFHLRETCLDLNGETSLVLFLASLPILLFLEKLGFGFSFSFSFIQSKSGGRWRKLSGGILCGKEVESVGWREGKIRVGD